MHFVILKVDKDNNKISICKASPKYFKPNQISSFTMSYFEIEGAVERINRGGGNGLNLIKNTKK